MFEVQFNLGFITVKKHLLYWFCFTDSDWAGDPNDQKSTTGYVFTLGSGPITWACKK